MSREGFLDPEAKRRFDAEFAALPWLVAKAAGSLVAWGSRGWVIAGDPNSSVQIFAGPDAEQDAIKVTREVGDEPRRQSRSDPIWARLRSHT